MDILLILFILSFTFLFVVLSSKSIVQIYNRLQNLREIVRQRFAEIQFAMTQRLNLMDSLTQILTNYKDHEYQSFTDYAKARSGLSNTDINQGIKSAQEIQRGFMNIRATFESNPDLKSNYLYRNLTGTFSISTLEKNLKSAVSGYNINVQNYNRTIKSFPTLIIAKMIGFKEINYFQLPEVEYKPLKIFDDKKQVEVA
jgi:LemA protein